jgi:hypothetical protein
MKPGKISMKCQKRLAKNIRGKLLKNFGKKKIAKIEQAIEKKYGKDAVLHPKNNWDEKKEQEYLKQAEEVRKKDRVKKEKTEKIEKDGFLISKKLLTKRSNRTCPVCETYSFSIKDDVYMNKYNCCFQMLY